MEATRGALLGLVLSGCLLAGTTYASDRERAGCPTYLPDLGCNESGRYPGFSAPMSMPYLFEDPFITSGVQAVWITQEIPGHSIFEGGYVEVAALQLRVALTDRLALIATRDGYARFKPDIGLMSHDSGFADLGIGLKYALVDRPDSGFILTPHLRYEPDSGSHALFQGMGDGALVPGLSFAWDTGHRAHVIGAVGAQIPLDPDANSTLLHYNLHVGYGLGWVAPFVELNAIRWVSGGDGSSTVHLANGSRLSLAQAQSALGSGSFEGFDFANLGSSGVAGDDMFSGAVGLRLALSDRVSFGFTYERPIGGRKDLMKHRFSVMGSYEF
jgi:hypothetical protein